MGMVSTSYQLLPTPHNAGIELLALAGRGGDRANDIYLGDTLGSGCSRSAANSVAVCRRLLLLDTATRPVRPRKTVHHTVEGTRAAHVSHSRRCRYLFIGEPLLEKVVASMCRVPGEARVLELRPDGAHPSPAVWAASACSRRQLAAAGCGRTRSTPAVDAQPLHATRVIERLRRRADIQVNAEHR